MADNTTEYNLSRGFIGVSSILTTRRKYDMSDEMIYRDRVIAKFWNILSRKMEKMKVNSYEPKMLDYAPEANVFPIANDASTGTSFTIANTYAQQLQAGDHIVISPKTVDAGVQSAVETVEVQSVGTAGVTNTTVTVIRNNGEGGAGSVDVAIADHDLIWAGNANMDGGPSGYPISKEPGIIQNYVQQFTKDVGETRAEKNETSVYGNMNINTKARMKRELLIEEVDWALTLGTLGKTWVDGAAKRRTRGVVGYVDSANLVDMTGKMGAPEFAEVANDTLFAYGNKRKEKWLLAGGGFCNYLDNIGWNESLYQRNAEYTRIVGFNVQEINLRAGRLQVVEMDTWRGTGWWDAALVLDMDYLSYMYVDDLQIAKDTADNNVKWNRKQWTMFGDIGLFAAYPKAHCLLHSPSNPS